MYTCNCKLYVTQARVAFLINMNSTQGECIATYTISGMQNTVYISACIIPDTLHFQNSKMCPNLSIVSMPSYVDVKILMFYGGVYLYKVSCWV